MACELLVEALVLNLTPPTCEVSLLFTEMLLPDMRTIYNTVNNYL